MVNDHDSAHPDDLTIPIVVGGGGVVPGRLPVGSSPMDVCATIPWVLGITPPSDWHGRPLREAFAPPRQAAVPAQVAA